MKSMIYYIGGLKRMLAFPYPVEEVGLMVNHYAMHRQNRLQRLFICFSFNADKYNPPETAGIPRFSVLFPGTVLNSDRPYPHDELFFSYSREVSERLMPVFAPLENHRGVPLELTPEFHHRLARLRELLEHRMDLGAADRIDALAIQIAFAAALQQREPEKKRTGGMKLQELALELKQGKNLNLLIRQYGYSRRSFYYEWNRTFAVSPHQMLLEHRLEQAMHLLVFSDLPVSGITVECGFSGNTYFHECFRKHLGCTPGEYRARYRNPESKVQ